MRDTATIVDSARSPQSRPRRVQARSLSRLARHVGSLAELALGSQDGQQYWTEIMTVLRGAIGFDSAYIGSTPGDLARTRLETIGHDRKGFLRTVPSLMLNVSSKEIASYTGHSRTETEIWTPERLAVLKALWNPVKRKHALIRVDWRQGRMVVLTLERCSYARNFDARDSATLDAIAPVVGLGDHLVANVLTKPSDGHENFGFTKRENQIVDLAVRGFSNLEIARLSSISPNTVRNILHSAFKKANVTTRAELGFTISNPVHPPETPTGPDSLALQAFMRRVMTAATSECQGHWLPAAERRDME